MCTVDVWQSALCVCGGVTEHDGHMSCQCNTAFAREGLGGQGHAGNQHGLPAV